MPPADTPALDDAEFGRSPIEASNEASLPIETEEEIPPASTPALEQAEEGTNEEGWDLEEEETSTQLAEPVPINVDFDQPALPVISSPAFTARDAETIDEVRSIRSLSSSYLCTDRPSSSDSTDRDLRSTRFPSRFERFSSRRSRDSCSRRTIVKRSRV